MPRYKDSPEERAAKQERREKLWELLALMEAEDVRDLKSVFKEMVGEVLENGLEAELDDKLGFTKYDYRNKDTDNSRNGHSVKTVISLMKMMSINATYSLWVARKKTTMTSSGQPDT